MPTLIATPGAANANSYVTLEEANSYFDERVPIVPPWPIVGDESIRALIMATRLLDAMAQPYRYLVPARSGVNGDPAHYIDRRQWTGTPATATQRLAWPRVGMYDRNGNEIAIDVIPRELQEATAELAGQLLATDLTQTNEVIAQGITSLKAGSVALTFKENILAQVLPDAVLNLLPSTWFTEELIEYVSSTRFAFEVL